MTTSTREDGPTTHLFRLTDALTRLCGGAVPPADQVAGWLDKAAGDERLQAWAIEHGPAWAQGIAVIDAAMVLADQPTEGIEHEHRDAAPALPDLRAELEALAQVCFNAGIAHGQGAKNDWSTDGKAFEIIDRITAAPQSAPETMLAKHQPCGCVICTCQDDAQCHGCKAKHCGTHPVGQFANPVYEAAPAAPNLACKSVQKRLATQWGYVEAAPATPSEDNMDRWRRVMLWAQRIHTMLDVKELATNGIVYDAARRAIFIEQEARAALEAAPAAQPQPVAWLRDQRDGHEGPETLDPLVVLGAHKPAPSLHGATYSPVVHPTDTAARLAALPDFMRRRFEAAIHESAHPQGVSIHDGRARVHGADLAYTLRVLDDAAARTAALEQAVSQLIPTLKDGLSVARTVDMSKARRASLGQTAMFMQTEDWCRWALEEVAPQLDAAIATLSELTGKGAQR